MTEQESPMFLDDKGQWQIREQELAFKLREKMRDNTSEDELSFPRICALVSHVILPLIKEAGFLAPDEDIQHWAEAIDRNTELKGELVREGRLEKADAVQLGIEALKRIIDDREHYYPIGCATLPGETEE